MARIQDDHKCKLRRRFENKSSASAAAHRISVVYSKHRQPEACHHCNGWHLSEASK